TYSSNNKNSHSYPTIAIRQNQIQVLSTSINKFSIIYETAKYLLQVGAVNQAAICYTYLYQFVKIPEIINDLAVCNLIWTLEATKVLLARKVEGFNSFQNYALPFEINPEARLLQKPTKGVKLAVESNETVLTSLKEKLRKVQTGLHQSLFFRPDFVSAHINLALLHLMQNPVNQTITPDSVEFYLNKASMLKPNLKQTFTMRLIEGIQLDLLHQKTAAQHIFKEIVESNFTNEYLKKIATINLKVSQEKQPRAQSKNNVKIVERIGTPFSVLFPDNSYTVISIDNHQVFFKETKDYKTFSFDRKYNFRIPTNTYYPLSICKLSKYTTNFDINHIFQNIPYQLFQDSSFYYYIYEGGICFCFDQNTNRLISWYSYRISD
ncbi:MAG: hypothetical protein AAGI07_20165, partial [Bacteroidota bacterium]